MERLDDLSVKMQRTLRPAQEDHPVSYSVTTGIWILVTRFILYESRELDIFVDLIDFLTEKKVSSSQFDKHIQFMKNELIPRMKRPKLKIL